MKKQEYLDMGIQMGLQPKQIEKVLCRIMGISAKDFFIQKDFSSRYIYEFQQALYALKNGVPESYAIGSCEFYGREFFVSQDVLIPRNDTELLVRQVGEKINTLFPHTESMIYVDVGTGSACIPVSVLLEMYPLRFAKAFALDISDDALQVAENNIAEYGLSEQITLQKSDLLESLFHESSLEDTSICMSANLPYIRSSDQENMDEQVILYEPDTALYGGEKTGFELYERLIKQCFQLKKIYHIPKIYLFIEIGYDQYEHSRAFLEEFGLQFEYFYDSARIARVIMIHGF